MTNTNTPRTVLFYGMSGAGKGTQARLLADALRATGTSTHFIETGQLLRDYAHHGGTFGAQRIRETIDGGNLVPQAVSSNMWSNILLKSVGEHDHIVLDGAARSVDEARLLDGLLDWLGRVYDIFILEVEPKVALERALARGSKRADDTEEGMANRLEWFKAKTMPAIDYMATQGARVHHIDGSRSIDEIHAEIRSILGV